MTIGAWFVVGLIALSGLVFVALFLWAATSVCEEKSMKIWWTIAAAVLLLITICSCGGFIWYRNNSESGRRALRDQESDLNGGIARTVSVYDISGALIKEYSGRFDIETDRESYILFDDEAGLRHMIYYTTGTIIIDER